MDREKKYGGRRLQPQGWRLLVKLADSIFKSKITRVSGTIWKDEGEWSFNALEDFLADITPHQSSLNLVHENGVIVKLKTFGAFAWSVENSDKAKIVDFEHEADLIVEANKITPPESPPEPVVVFIGHGGSGDWRALKDHLTEKHGIKVVAYETGSRSGHAIRDVLEGMLGEATLAILVHTPEDEMVSGSFTARPNVIHETGLFQGRLGFARAIVMLKEPTTEFSNLAGTQQIRYSEIRETFGDVIAWIKREEN